MNMPEMYITCLLGDLSGIALWVDWLVICDGAQISSTCALELFIQSPFVIHMFTYANLLHDVQYKSSHEILI